MSDLIEEWRAIPDFENYEVSSAGGVRRRVGGSNSKAGKVMRTRIGVTGYPRITLHQDGRKYETSVHRVVALAFLGAPPFPGAQVAHWDGDRTNCHISNLRWATPKENGEDMARHGRSQFGTKHKLSKLNEQQVLEIRASTLPQRQIARLYGVAQSTVWSIINGQHWLSAEAA